MGITYFTDAVSNISLDEKRNARFVFRISDYCRSRISVTLKVKGETLKAIDHFKVLCPLDTLKNVTFRNILFAFRKGIYFVSMMSLLIVFVCVKI